ncbi:MAG: substrate-binding domain-containing protein [Pirellulaceae bacterium]|nr:helix-turn-helix domain-containing protein [Planctomycetales bacterium]
MSPSNANKVRQFRRQRGWSQGELATRAGVSRAAVSAVEQQRLAPSVTSAMALARALQRTVEELFGDSPTSSEVEAWAWQPHSWPCRYWHAEVGGQRWLYPSEPTNLGEIPYDGTCQGKSKRRLQDSVPEDVLVIATCDPAIGLLASEYARQTPFRILPFTRSSRQSLTLLTEGKVHIAGVHLSGSHRSEGNAVAAREVCGEGACLVRVGVWQEGIASATHLDLKSSQQAVSSRLKWVGREAGSGARDCLDELLAGRTPPRRLAPDHRSVALAIRYGWADAGVCLRLAGEEAGLNFLDLRREAYDLCASDRTREDRRVLALIDVIRSTPYRRLLGTLPGYDARTTGDVFEC